MQQLPKEFVGRMVRTVLFIGLVAACCAGVATFGMFVASKFNLTTSRNQVPLTSVKIEGERVLIPENGKTTREAGWTVYFDLGRTGSRKSGYSRTGDRSRRRSDPSA